MVTSSPTPGSVELEISVGIMAPRSQVNPRCLTADASSRSALQFEQERNLPSGG